MSEAGVVRRWRSRSEAEPVDCCVRHFASNAAWQLERWINIVDVRTSDRSQVAGGWFLLKSFGPADKVQTEMRGARVFW